jgi:hypothetical protein
MDSIFGKYKPEFGLGIHIQLHKKIMAYSTYRIEYGWKGKTDPKVDSQKIIRSITI